MSQLLFQDYSIQANVRPGAERTELYLSRLEGKKIGIVTNHTSMLGKIHLVDSLAALGREVVEICKIFGPEHGFRGKGEDAVPIEDDVDQETGLPVISLYGRKRKPTAGDLADLDLLLFDIQDVGVRFYTYISTLFYVMQACAENDLELILLDRPNPNGSYVDGPVLEAEFSSFEGMHEVPVPPSPNLPTMNSILLYPSVCFFEGTVISEGRGTDSPFEVFGHPDLQEGDYSFTPVSIPGTDSHPKQEGKRCRGVDLRYLRNAVSRNPGINHSWLIFAYENFPEKEKFFTPFFEKLAGTARLRQQIIEGLSKEEIRTSWAEDLEAFKVIRRKYLIYPE